MPENKHFLFKELDALYAEFQKASKEVAGYPIPQTFDYSKLFHFLKFHINNLGDPFLDSWYYRINTLKFEKEVIDECAKLFHAPKDNYWGYVTSGGTEGNLYGLYVARELYPDSVVFYSDQTHYSVPKNLKLLRMNHIKIPSDPSGEINYQALQKELTDHKTPPIILANIGTTMKGAVDDVCRIKEILADLKITQYYIHCDAAFFGMILPFLPEIEAQPFDFRLGIDSIAISGHKMIGTPMPCGIILVKKSSLNKIGSHIEYTGVIDNTIAGSRNGLNPLFLWFELKCALNGKLQKIVEECLESASYAVKKFNDAGIPAWRNKNSLIIVFPRPSDKTVRKWQLAVEGPIGHIVTLPHLSNKTIDLIVKHVVQDLKKPKTSRKKLPTILP